MGASGPEPKHSAESYKILFDKSPQPMWVFDRASLAFLAVNEAAIEHYGYSRKEFLSMTIRDIRATEDVPRLTIAAHRIKGKHFRNPALWRHRKKDGSWIDVEITSNDEVWNGRPARLVLVNDVTQRVEAERGLLEWQRRYETAARASHQVVFEWNFENDEITFGVNLEGRFGYEQDELGGQTQKFIDRIHVEDRPAFLRELARVSKSREKLAIEFRLQRKPDGWFDVEARGDFMETAEPRMVGFFSDMSQRRTLEKQLAQAQKMEAVGRLASGIAHDFNNFLGVVLGYAELIQTREDHGVCGKYATSIQSAARSASRLTHDLLAFSRQQVLQPRTLDLNAVLGKLRPHLERVITKDVELVILKSPDLRSVRLDETQLQQLLLNLVINARDAMPRGGKIMVETSNVNLDRQYCELHEDVKPGRYVMLAITDTGVGMDSTTLSRIFDPFFTTKSQGHGTGLGLAMVYGTVRQSGGHIWVYSEPNQGATFKLYFPQVDAPPDRELEERVPAVIHGSETVLLAEDEDSYRALISEVLTSAGYRVLAARDGMEALNLASSWQAPIHILLTDAVLPKMNGKVLAQNLHATHPNTKVLFMSGYTSNVIVHHGMLDAGVQFLQKPVTPSQLLQKLRQVLDLEGEAGEIG